ncbi:serine-type D-Ala-D-Ala carboxypeptidase [Xenorhabdus sp. 12]|uniref:serine-type D-Ala-D-Ala carboxypeptidase n=1 Tax=Xenorhabdus santafensis TaxID=2582833 RepID=A0ABU4SEU3_9GAMM|nr:serine hydrolase [Xenorhabdus sp. 12]MDX7989305.1 serine-type D-Ala-D-Ala carboxypeptidase [Xenorhabdus sp. 12]
MKKRRQTQAIKSFAVGLGVFWLINASVYAMDEPTAPEINAKAYVLMDYASGKVLASQNADERLDPASLTKIMTSYVIGKAIKSEKISNQDSVMIGREAWATGNPVLKGSSLMFLQPGEMVKVSDLNRGIVIQSGNDASIALANFITGSQDTFVELMNKYSETLGLKNTHFKTVHGLDAAGQYSTALDMALLSKALIHDVPDEYALNKEKEFTFNNIRQPNRNRLLWNKNLNVDGVKTGHTSGAGYNLVASATEGPMRLISVVLGAPSDRMRFSDSEKLLSWGFRFYESATLLKASDTLVTERVWYGTQSDVALGVEKDASIVVPRGQSGNLKASFTLDKTSFEAPLAKNQVVGTVNFMLNDKVIEQRPLVVKEAVEETGIFGRIWDFVVKTVTGWFNSIFG